METGSDWYQDGEPHYFKPHNLFEYINGSAELYLAYDFQKLITVTFLNSLDQSLTIDIYDMGNALNAFGVYSNFRNPQDATVAVGTDAIISDYYIRLYHGQYVVDLNSSDSDDMMKKLMLRAATEIERKIDAEKTFPGLLRLLPEKGVVQRTQKYISEAMLGHKFLPRGLEAKYKLGQNEVKAFVVLCDSFDIAQRTMEDFKSYISNRGALLGDVSIDSVSAVTGEIPYHDRVIFAVYNSYLYGVIDLPAIDSGVPLMKDLYRAITAN